MRRQVGRVASLAVLGGHNYFHWMFQLLPRIELLRQAGMTYDAIDWFATNKIQHPFQEETLSTMGVPTGRILEVGEDDHLQVDTLLVPSRPSRMSDMPLWVCDFLRKTFLPPEDNNHAAGAEYLYLTREHSPHRNIRNESEIRQFLEKRGFTTVAPETMSVADQARTLRRASVVVAPHGAALTNLVFCRPGVTVIEIFNPRYINGCYWMLSSWVGARYHYMLGVGEKPSESDVPFEQYGSLEVDVDSLSRLLRLAGV
jgi:capsular polysaccharide biosynthesis protein